MNNTIVAEFQKQAWAMEPKSLNALILQMSEIDHTPLAAVSIGAPAATLQVDKGVARISIRGVLMDDVPAIFRWFGIQATSYGDIRDLISQALGDDKIKSIVLDVDSPGGVVGSVLETADVIVKARDQKKITAEVGGVAASSAYWLMSQAKKITAGPNSAVGSIGIYTVFADFSKAAEIEGVVVHVIRSGDLKGMGVTGAAISAEQIAAMQEYVDGIAANLIKSVANGRGLPLAEVKALATGQLWIAKKAKSLGLVDSIRSASSLTSENSILGEVPMTETNSQEAQTGAASQTNAAENSADSQPTAADAMQRFAAIKAAFPEDLAFATAQFEAGATVDQAKAAYAEVLREKLKASEKKNTDLQAKIDDEASTTAADAGGEGAEATGAGETGKTTGETNFMVVARERAEKDGKGITAAMKAVAHEQPDLHADWVANIRPVKNVRARRVDAKKAKA